MNDFPVEACPLCGGDNHADLATVQDVEMHSVPDAFTYRNCRDCDIIYITQQPRQRLHLIYPPTYYSVAGPTNPRLLERIKAWLDKHLLRRILAHIPGQALSVLDIGGGSGWISDHTRAVDARVSRTVIVDQNEKARTVAVSHGHEFFCQRIEDFRSDSKFDLILMLNIIEHLAEPEKVMQQVKSLLSEHGRILVKTPNTQTLDRRIFEKHYWGGYHCPRHWILFNAGSFTQLCQRNGLAIETLSYTQGAPQWAQSVLGTLARKNLIRYSTTRVMYDGLLFKMLLAGFALFDMLRCPFFKTAQMFIVLRHATDRDL
jgi:2-polyprenyl-3-methyl-5-hydroxy-6-metoxy-1,4-benzoquinol methylase